MARRKASTGPRRVRPGRVAGTRPARPAKPVSASRSRSATAGLLVTAAATRKQRTPAKRRRLATKGAPPKHGFVSRQQWKWAFATRQPWAREHAHKTKGGKGVRFRRLPPRKGGPSARTAL